MAAADTKSEMAAADTKSEMAALDIKSGVFAADVKTDACNNMKKTEQKNPDTRVPKLHAVLEKGVSPEYLAKLHPQIMAIFKPSRVKYTNPNLEKEEGDDENAVHHKEVVWRASSYMEIDAAMGGAMQKGTKCDLEMLKLCTPLLQMCDAAFSKWYTGLHGEGSIHKLKRLQSFVTRYRPIIHENGLVRHVDGAQVDGSVVMGLPTPNPFTGGGLTVWEGTPGTPEEVSWYYPVNPGDICFLDNFVYHQGDPIASGERWALVIFYRCKLLSDRTKHRWGRVLTQFAKQQKGQRKNTPSLPAAHVSTAVAGDKTPKRVFSDLQERQAIGASILAHLAEADCLRAVRAVLEDGLTLFQLRDKLSPSAGTAVISLNILVMRSARALKPGHFNPKARHLKAMIHSLVAKGLIRRNALRPRSFELVLAVSNKIGDDEGHDITADATTSGTAATVTPAAAAVASCAE